MSLNIPTQIGINFRAQLAPDGDGTGGAISSILVDLLFANGTGANQADGVFFDSRVLVASANEDIDLQLILDENKNALAAEQVAVLIIQTPATNLGTIQMNDSAATPWISYLSSSGATDDARLDFLPGTTQILVCTPAVAYDVGAGNKIINFINLDGVNSNTYLLAVLTRSV